MGGFSLQNAALQGVWGGEAPSEKIKIRSSYNLSGISFTPKEIAAEISKHIPNFEISYNPDFRQKIADSWPSSINDEYAQNDWGWELKYSLQKMTQDMIMHLKNENKTATLWVEKYKYTIPLQRKKRSSIQ